MTEGFLARITNGEVEPHGGDDEDQPVTEQVDAVVLHELRRDQHQQSSQKSEDRGPLVVEQRVHTLRSSFLPSRPWGLKRMTTIKMINATASL